MIAAVTVGHTAAFIFRFSIKRENYNLSYLFICCPGNFFRISNKQKQTVREKKTVRSFIRPYFLVLHLQYFIFAKIYQQNN